MPEDTVTNCSFECAWTSATFAADDIFSASVNGVEVGSSNESEPFMQVHTFDVTNLLFAGPNSITISVTNLGFHGDIPQDENPGGLLYSLSTVPSSCASGTDQGSGNGGGSGGSTSGQYNETFNSNVGVPATTTPGSSTTTVVTVTKNPVPTGSVLGASTSAQPTSTSTGSTTTEVLQNSAASTTALAAGVGFLGNMPFYGWLALVLLLIAIFLVLLETYNRTKTKV